MPDYVYAYEKLLGAVEIMATGKGSRADRLARATHQYLFRIRKVKANDLPADLATRLAEFIEEMTAKRGLQPWENAVDKTAQTMPWQTAERLSRQLLGLFLAVSALRSNGP
ncbi:hypothetical protein BH11PSE6_BH11PSE6_11670 [soil metagenome]